MYASSTYPNGHVDQIAIHRHVPSSTEAASIRHLPPRFPPHGHPPAAAPPCASPRGGPAIPPSTEQAIATARPPQAPARPGAPPPPLPPPHHSATLHDSHSHPATPVALPATHDTP